MLYVPNRWNDGDAIFRKRDAILETVLLFLETVLLFFSNMTSTFDNLKQIRTLITFKNVLGDDSRVKNSQFDERNYLRYSMARGMRKISVCMYAWEMTS